MGGYDAEQLGCRDFKLPRLGVFSDENGSSAQATRCSSVRFLHLLEGTGDFDGKALRAGALIEAVNIKKVAHQKIPAIPEILTE